MAWSDEVSPIQLDLGKRILRARLRAESSSPANRTTGNPVPNRKKWYRPDILRTRSLEHSLGGLNSIFKCLPRPLQRALFIFGRLAWWVATPHLAPARYRYYSSAWKGVRRENVMNIPLHKEVAKPNVLFVISTLSGGTPQTNADLMEAISNEYQPFLLRCDSQIIEFSKIDLSGMNRLETIALTEQIQPFPHTSQEYDGILSDILSAYDIKLVHIRHIGWHSLNLPKICRFLGIPVLFSFHDFYTICPTVKLLDENMEFCAGKCTATQGACKPELWPKETMPNLKHHTIHGWQTAMKHMLDDCDGYITTSHSTQEQIARIFPDTLAKRFSVISHGRDLEMTKLSDWYESDDIAIRILVPGNIVPAKGAHLIEALIELDTEKLFEFHILGYSSLPKSKRVILHGSYDRDNFTAKVRKIKPHLGAVLSIWPETFCHTLTEMWACGVPVLALDYGAVGERLHENGAGWLVKGKDPKEIYNRFLQVVSNKEDYLDKIAHLHAWQIGEGASETTQLMASSYTKIYSEMMENAL